MHYGQLSGDPRLLGALYWGSFVPHDKIMSFQICKYLHLLPGSLSLLVWEHP